MSTGETGLGLGETDSGLDGMAMAGGFGGPTWIPVSTTSYYYNDGGNVTWIIEEFFLPASGEPLQVITQFHYARNGRAVTFVAGWTKSTSGVYDVTYLREFRYDGARERYLNRELDPDVYQSSGSRVVLGETWSDYDGDSIYGDYRMVEDPESPGDWVDEDLRSYQPGIGTFGWTSGGPDPTTLKHYHTDMIGTTRMMTDSGGAADSPAAFTAFGQRISGDGQRYGYAGAYGYQTATSETQGDAYATDFKFLHVGARYYDPATGRFLQRDPIGIAGGLNVYAYVGSSPAIRVDPSGLADELDCQRECDKWWKGGGMMSCGVRSNEDCYYSCSDGLWPRPPAKQPPPKPFKPWPGCCPPKKVPRPPIKPKPSRCGVTGIEPVPVLLFLVWVRRRRSSRSHRIC